MNRSSRITSAPQRRLRLMIGAQFFWLTIVCLLGAWWCRLVLNQASRIAELETSLGMVPEAMANQLRTGRMVFWESLSYFTVLIASTFIVFWLYWRDGQRSRGVQAFFASMTHELRTPLTSIRLQAESIAENLSTDLTQKHLVDRLLEDTMRLESQVERTLELARVEGGGPVFPEVVELKPWMDRLVSGWRESYGDRVRIDAHIGDVSIVVDPTALGVIMRNLLENSVRHTQGSIGAESVGDRDIVSKSSRLTVTIEAIAEVNKVTLRFRDNGPGFSGDANRLGTIFEKGSGSKGTGVGLYLIRVLVEQMGGQVEFNRGPGFEVVLRFLATTESKDTRDSDGGMHG